MDSGNGRPLVAVGTITAGNPRFEYMTSIIDALHDRPNGEPGTTINSWIAIPNGSYLDIGRNKTVYRYRDVNAALVAEGSPPNDYLLFIDDDTAFTCADIDNIVDAAELHYLREGVRPVIGGAYLGSSPDGAFVVAYKLDDSNPQSHMRDLAMSEVTDEGSAVIPVDGLGTGFMLIHNDILEAFEAKFPPPMVWFQDVVSSVGDRTDPGWFGEDLFFCLRAATLGHPSLLHCGVRLTHYKTQGLVFPKE